MPTRIYHGTNDDGVPIEPVRAVAQKVCPRLTFAEVVDDHFLSKTLTVIPWLQLIEPVEAMGNPIGVIVGRGRSTFP